MKKLSVFRWLFLATLAASLPITVQAAGGHNIGGHSMAGHSMAGRSMAGRSMAGRSVVGGPHFSGARGLDFALQGGRFRNRFFAHDRFFRHHHRFVSDFAFVGFGFPDWYPDYYDPYPDDYSNYEGEPGYNDPYLDESSVPTLSELVRRANYTASFEGISRFGSALPRGSSNDRGGYRSTGPEEQDTNVVREPNESAGGKADPVTIVTPTPKAQAGSFANLILVGWLNDAGKDVIFVQNTETKKLQKVTSEPNKDNLRVIEIRPNADPKLVEAVISDGTDQGTVKVAKRD